VRHIAHIDITAATRRLQPQSYPWAMPCVVKGSFRNTKPESGLGFD